MNYLVVAYAAIWLLFFIYLFTLKSRQRDLEKSVEALQKQSQKQ